MWVSQVAKKLLLNYSTIYSIKKEYSYDLNQFVVPFNYIQQKRRISKALVKAIYEFLSDQKESFTIKDVVREVKIKAKEEIKDYIIQKHIKDSLEMSNRRWTNKPRKVDVPILLILRSLFRKKE